MKGYKEKDAIQLAAWGVDLVFADAAFLEGDSATLTQGLFISSFFQELFIIHPFYLQPTKILHTTSVKLVEIFVFRV